MVKLPLPGLILLPFEPETTDPRPKLKRLLNGASLDRNYLIRDQLVDVVDVDGEGIGGGVLLLSSLRTRPKAVTIKTSPPIITGDPSGKELHMATLPPLVPAGGTSWATTGPVTSIAAATPAKIVFSAFISVL